MQGYRHSIPVSGGRVKSTAPNHHAHGHDQSLSEDGMGSVGEPAFETQNFLYELQSRCNNLEYEKTKNSMMHDNIVNDLQNKIEYLEVLSSTLSQQNQSLSQERDLLRTLLAEVREQNYSFSKEISQLRIEMNGIITDSRSQDAEQSYDLRAELQKKDETIRSLQKQLASSIAPNKQAEMHFQEFEKSNARLKEELSAVHESYAKSKSEAEALMRRLTQNDLNFQEQRKNLFSELNHLRESLESKSREKSSANNEESRRMSQLLQVKEEKIKIAQNQRLALQSKVNELTLEVGRLKCQKNNLQQLNEYLENNAEENEAKRKQLQEELFQSQKEISELRTQMFTEKLQYKKQLNALKLEFEEERIRYAEQMQQQSKEVNKLREQNSHSNRQAVDMEELSMKTQGIITDLDKANNQISKLESENESLRRQLTANQDKLQKKHQKYCNLQNKLKAQNAERIKALETSIYKLQQANNELEVKLELLSRKTMNENSKADNSELIELMKSQVREKDQIIRQLEQKAIELEQTKRNLQYEIGKLEAEARGSRELRSAESVEDKITTVQLLRQEIENLKQEVGLSRQTNQRLKRQYSFRQEKIRQQLLMKEKDCESYRREKELLESLNSRLEKELEDKDKHFMQLREQLLSTRQQRQRLKQDQQTEGINTKNSVPEYIRSEKCRVVASDEQERSLLQRRVAVLEKENIALKVDYSNSLQQINAILLRYQSLEEKYTRLSQTKDKHNSDTQNYRIRITQLENQCQRLRHIIHQQEETDKHLRKLINQLRQQHKLNNTFAGSQARKSRRESEHLWLVKDYRVAERDDNDPLTFRHQRHRI